MFELNIKEGGRDCMNVRRVFAPAAIAAFLLASQLEAQTPLHDDDDIAGVVSSTSGPDLLVLTTMICG